MTTVRRVTGQASVLLAPNPSVMTLSGTNTWLLRATEPGPMVVVDPGPIDDGHLERIVGSGDVALILLTHGHQDHSEAVDQLSSRTQAPVRAADPSWCRGAAALGSGERVEAAGLTIDVITTPGHTADSVCFRLPDDRPLPGSPAGESAGSVLTGDTVLGEGTTVVAYPDGRLAAYLDSLSALSEMRGMVGLPGHGPVRGDVAQAAEMYLAHRRMRLEQVREAVRAGARTPTQVVERVYADVDRSLWPAAELSVRAQLEYLEQPESDEARP